MGYYITTIGEFAVTPPMSHSHRRLFNHFSRERNPYGGYWRVSADGTKVLWEDDINKDRPDPESLKTLIKLFVAPPGYTVSGIVRYVGELHEDSGSVKVINNTVSRTKHS